MGTKERAPLQTGALTVLHPSKMAFSLYPNTTQVHWPNKCGTGHAQMAPLRSPTALQWKLGRPWQIRRKRNAQFAIVRATMGQNQCCSVLIGLFNTFLLKFHSAEISQA